MKRIFLILFLHFSITQSFAQSFEDTLEIRKQLAVIFERDQQPRKSRSNVQQMVTADSIKLIKVEELIVKYGWPGKSFVGVKGNNTVWLVIHHAELPVQLKYLPLMEQSVGNGESSTTDLALLQDRILMRQGKKQRYGSQISLNSKSGMPEIWPIEDEKNVNQRRTSIGLEPMEDYAKKFGLNYFIPGK